jgi:hypothetical protein
MNLSGQCNDGESQDRQASRKRTCFSKINKDDITWDTVAKNFKMLR